MGASTGLGWAVAPTSIIARVPDGNQGDFWIQHSLTVGCVATAQAPQDGPQVE